MASANFDAFMALVWPANGGFDSPKQGYHATTGDAGGGTYGGVIEATWQECVAEKIVTGALRSATGDQLRNVLHAKCWGPTCDALPSGVDVLVANGRMMSGRFAALFEECLGFTGEDVDNQIGPNDLGAVSQRDAVTLIHAVFGRHYHYLRYELAPGQWAEFGNGWTTRLKAAHGAALAVAAADGA